jgi:gliding motility-associated-like protein
LDNTATTVYTFTPTAGLCAATATLTITVNQKVVPTFAAVAPICSGATLSALPTTSTNGVTGTWSPALNNTTTTTYTFTPSSGQCATTTTLSITVNPVTAPVFSAIGPLCSGTIISLPTLSINGIAGTWLPAFNPTATTTYTFTPSSGQCASTTTLTIVIIALPVATATPKDSFICSDTTTAISLSSNTTGTTYVWNVVQTNVTGALAGSGDSIAQTLQTAVDNKSGEAVYSITPTANGCPGLPVLATVTVNPIPDVTANPSPATVCSGERTSIVLSSKVAGTTFSWTTDPLAVIGSFPDTGSTIAQTLVTNSSIPGTVDYTITPTASSCVGVPITVNVTVNPTPEVFGSAGTVICSGESTNIILSPKILGTDFTWTVVQNGVTGAEDGGGGNTIDQILEAGTTVGTAAYTITPILNGCKGKSITIVITVNPSPQPELEDGIICVEEATNTTYKNYVLDTGLSDSLYDFNWFKESVKISGASASTYEATAEGLYSVIVTNTLTSCISEEVFATVIPNYPAESLTTTVTDAFTPEATLTVNPLGGTGPFLYRLDDGPLQSSNVFVGVNSGVHTVWVEDGQGCTQLSREVTVIDYPRYFTPNGDGFNDTWKIVGLENQPEAKIYIFDRYGKLLKQISTVGEGWNGTFNGRELPASDYWFTIEYLESNTNKLFKAHFSLKR